MKYWVCSLAAVAAACLASGVFAGGGGDGGGVDVLPYYAILEGAHGGYEKTIVEGPDGWTCLLFEEGSPGLDGFPVIGVGFELWVSWPPAIEDPATGAMLQPVHISGLVGDEVVNSSGYAVPGSDGRLCLIDAETWESPYPKCYWRLWNEASLRCTSLFFRVDPIEVGDGDLTDIIGFVHQSECGLLGRRPPKGKPALY